MNFNIRYREGKQVVFPAKQDAAFEDQGKLNVSLSQDHCQVRTNAGGEPSRLQLVLQRKRSLPEVKRLLVSPCGQVVGQSRTDISPQV